MNRTFFALIPLVLLTTLASAEAPQQKPPDKSSAKQTAKPPSAGVKGASQMAGGAIRFGEIFALRTGYTYQILSARYSLDPVAHFTETTNANEKLLVLAVAVKNNRKEDLWFNPDSYAFQAVDSMNQNYEGAACILSSKPGESLNPTLKPGQGLGQNAADPVLVVVKMPIDARLVKLILKQGREGTSEEVLRFFLADATETEAGGKPDPKNIIAPLPKWAEKGAIIPQAQYVPSNAYYFKLNSFSTAEKISGTEPDEGKKWVIADITLKNPRQTPQGTYNFYAGDSIGEMALIDGDGEKYPALRFLKAKSDEEPSIDLEALEEKPFRIVFQVPKNVTCKTIRLGSPGHHLFVFDASAAGK